MYYFSNINLIQRFDIQVIRTSIPIDLTSVPRQSDKFYSIPIFHCSWFELFFLILVPMWYVSFFDTSPILVLSNDLIFSHVVLPHYWFLSNCYFLHLSFYLLATWSFLAEKKNKKVWSFFLWGGVNLEFVCSKRHIKVHMTMEESIRTTFFSCKGWTLSHYNNNIFVNLS